MNEIIKLFLSIVAIPAAIFGAAQSYINLRRNSATAIKADLELLALLEKDSVEYEIIKKQIDKKISFTYMEKPTIIKRYFRLYHGLQMLIFGAFLIFFEKLVSYLGIFDLQPWFYSIFLYESYLSILSGIVAILGSLDMAVVKKRFYLMDEIHKKNRLLKK